MFRNLHQAGIRLSLKNHTMNTSQVTFYYLTGIKKEVFRNARLKGSWDENGVHSEHWTETPMTSVTGEDGCPAFRATTTLRYDSPDTLFKWGVELDGPGGNHLWGIISELPDAFSAERYCVFTPDGSDLQTERYYFTFCRKLGANKVFEENSLAPALQFDVWAPHARAVSVVFGKTDSGYIYHDGRGIDTSKPEFVLRRAKHGIWESEVIPSFETYMSLPYMYKIVNAQEHVVYRTDIYSRSQIGSGAIDPAHSDDWPGTCDTLNGSKSCSIIIDPDGIRPEFERPASGLPHLVSAEEFWTHEFDINRPVPAKVEELVIYELHVGALGFDKDGPGTLADALGLLDHLTDLGVNAIELLPMADFSGNVGWGYGTTHHMVIHSAAGGRDQYRHFIRECHRRGMAVIQDVVFNHYDGDAERAQWQYDSELPEENGYYWFERKQDGDYNDPHGGYIDNGSSGWAPNYREEIVRHQFISASVFLVEEMHVDGLRVDLTQAIHRDNWLHENGSSVTEANLFGQKLLREWSRTLKIIKPSAILIAEDHTGWDAVTQLPADGGLGFDATWFVDFYHGLIGDADSSDGQARLLKNAGPGFDDQLSMEQFAANLFQSQFRKVVYHESHDEAGNAGGSARTMSVAVNKAPIFGETRFWAERRSRTVFGLSVLSPGTPMFLMGEEIGAMKHYTYDRFTENREDLTGERTGEGGRMFRFYQDIIRLSKMFTSVRNGGVDILHVHNANRIIAFKRYAGNEQLLVIASLDNQPYGSYTIASDPFRLPPGIWKEIFNSDSEIYGGANFGNAGAEIGSDHGSISVAIPASGFLVLVRAD
jgi:1,4-alpha-glucan branching enzyme